MVLKELTMKNCWTEITIEIFFSWPLFLLKNSTTIPTQLKEVDLDAKLAQKQLLKRLSLSLGHMNAVSAFYLCVRRVAFLCVFCLLSFFALLPLWIIK